MRSEFLQIENNANQNQQMLLQKSTEHSETVVSVKMHSVIHAEVIRSLFDL